MHRAGRLPGAAVGVVLGHEVAGEVVELGEGPNHLAVGDRVVVYQRRFCGTCRECARGRQDLCRALGLPSIDTEGAYAEYLCVPAASAVVLPDGLDYSLAALACCPIATSVRALTLAGLQPGERVLINGASGGLGAHQIQIARALGAHVIATTGTAAKRDFLQSLGAHEVIVAGEQGYSADVWICTRKQGVDVAMENLGHTLPDTLRAMGMGGRVVVLGNVEGREVSIAPGLLIGRRISVQGSGSATLEDLRRALAMIAAGQVRPLVDRVLPFTEVARAHALLDARQVSGRIVMSGW